MSFETHLVSDSKEQTLCSERSVVGEEALTNQAPQHIFFEKGIIGFGNEQEYILAPAPKESLKPFQVLIHAQNPNIHFLVLKFGMVEETVSMALRQDIAQQMNLDPKFIEGYYLVTTEGIEQNNLTFSINKRAPVFIDPVHQKGGQYIMKNQELPLVFILTHLSEEIRKRLRKD